MWKSFSGSSPQVGMGIIMREVVQVGYIPSLGVKAQSDTHYSSNLLEDNRGVHSLKPRSHLSYYIVPF